uniref:Uncharacterized protein n=1 Tax=Arundo donax TaxID=35708 RepID=A0A0A9B4I8_ARUDO
MIGNAHNKETLMIGDADNKETPEPTRTRKLLDRWSNRRKQIDVGICGWVGTAPVQIKSEVALLQMAGRVRCLCVGWTHGPR